PTPGPGHRAVEACQTCHAEPQTHAPGGTALPCTQCHDPHGSRNINLVRETITTPSGANRPIEFNNLLGPAHRTFPTPSAATAPGGGRLVPPPATPLPCGRPRPAALHVLVPRLSPA